jgi:iron transport multicopper oxidase
MLGVVAAILVALAGARGAAAEVTGAADNLRTGWYPDEPALAPGNITKERFKQLFEDKLEGQIYAQPLTANGTLLVVTEQNWAYGLDPASGIVRWKRQLGTAVEAGESPEAPIKCTDLEPRVGITGTPVIDTERGVAYLVSNRYVSGGSGPIGWYMHALELSTGNEVAGFPVQITGEAQNLSPETVPFEPAQELQRPALLMMNGVVFAAFGSHCDNTPYEGWLVGVSASTGQVVTKWATSAAHGGAIWQSGGGLVSDGPGRILFSTGNDAGQPGVWDPPEGPGTQSPAPEGRLGEAVVRVEAQPGGALATKDYFSPFNSTLLDELDLDVGSSAPVGLPAPYFGTSKLPHLLVQESKTGAVYVLDRDGLGGRGKEANNVVQELGPYSGVWGAAGVWPGEGGYVVIPTPSLRFLKAGESSGSPTLSEVAHTADEASFGSGSPIVTSNGTAGGSGVAWITWCPAAGCAEAELRAYNPASSGEPEPLWTAKVGFASKFSRPDASGGHIYVGNREGAIIAFGVTNGEPAPSVRALSPRRGPAGGGTTIRITGSHFTGATAVSFGSVGATSFSVNSPTSITAVAPAEAAARVDVTVTTPNGPSATSRRDRFRFVKRR